MGTPSVGISAQHVSNKVRAILRRLSFADIVDRMDFTFIPEYEDLVLEGMAIMVSHCIFFHLLCL
jgi:hypothetical protein